MADMMAIVSKAVFEKAAGKNPAIGTCLRIDRYVSTNKSLERLTGGGKLYMVTVRPPDDALWLVAILDNPTFDGEQWIAKPCELPIIDLGELKDRLVFESGKGLSAAKGALGMSLQTPRVVTAEDARLLDAAAGVAAIAAPARDYPAAPEGAIATGAGNRRELLLQALVDDPDNHDARQVYADALVGANDPRGELILLDTALDGPLAIRKRDAMKRQRDALLATNAKKWWPYNNVRLRVHRGFVTSVSGTPKALAAAAKLFQTEPVTDVEVRSISGVDGIERVLAAPWLPRIHRLAVRGKLGNAGFAALVAAPAAQRLRSLNVTGNKITAEGIAKLGAHLPEVRTLVLTNNKLGHAGIVGLLSWVHLARLEALYLGNCDLDATAVGALLDGPPLASLAKLALSANQLGNGAGAQFEANAAKLPALRHLDLSNTGLQTAGARQLVAAKLPAVKRIDLRANRIDTKLAESDPRLAT